MDLSSKIYNICTKADFILAVRGAYRRSYLTVINKKNLGAHMGIDLKSY
jgi:hypothetical protein